MLAAIICVVIWCSLNIVAISLIKEIPSCPISSSLPTKGLTNEAPLLAAKSAWLAENTRVILTLIFYLERIEHALSPSSVMGIFITTFLPSLERSLASSIIDL